MLGHYNQPTVGESRVSRQVLQIILFSATFCLPDVDIPRVNSLAPGRFQWNLRKIIFKLILVTDISSEIALRWTSLGLSDDKSTLVQVMAWCRQATSQYLSQCWPGSLSPYGVTRPQWVKKLPTSAWREYIGNYILIIVFRPSSILTKWFLFEYAAKNWYIYLSL